MKILLDECVTKKLIPFLSPHDVFTVSQKKWNGLRNGELLKNTENEGFDILLTIDKKILHQQNISRFNLIIIIFDTPSSEIEQLKLFIPNLLSQLESFKKKNFYIISK